MIVLMKHLFEVMLSNVKDSDVDDLSLMPREFNTLAKNDLDPGDGQVTSSIAGGAGRWSMSPEVFHSLD